MRKTKLSILTGIICLLLTGPLFGQLEWVRPLSKGRLNLPISIHPDFPGARFGKSATFWNNRIGLGLSFLTYKSSRFNLGFTLESFVNLHDLEPGQLISWQLWRAHVGGYFYLEAPQLFPSKYGRLVFKTGYGHESQHATDQFSYVANFMTIPPEAFNNATARSFEYFPFQLNYTWTDRKGDWLFLFAPEYKLYPRSGSGFKWVDTAWDITGSTALEIGVHRRIAGNKETKLFAFVHGFVESIGNDFVSSQNGYWGNRNGEPLTYRSMEMGLLIKHREGTRMSFFVELTDSDGRGLDFPIRHRGIGLGFKIFL